MDDSQKDLQSWKVEVYCVVTPLPTGNPRAKLENSLLIHVCFCKIHDFAKNEMTH